VTLARAIDKHAACTQTLTSLRPPLAHIHETVGNRSNRTIVSVFTDDEGYVQTTYRERTLGGERETHFCICNCQSCSVNRVHLQKNTCKTSISALYKHVQKISSRIYVSSLAYLHGMLPA
jgi:hypothetical protein